MAAFDFATAAVTMTNANTEYSLALPAEARWATLQCRSGDDVRIAFVTGKVAAPTEPYFTLKAGQRLDVFKAADAGRGNDAITIYAACGAAGKVLEMAYGAVN